MACLKQRLKWTNTYLRYPSLSYVYSVKYSIDWFLVFYQKIPETECTEFSKQRLRVTSLQSCTGDKTCSALQRSRQISNIIWVEARLEVGFSFLIMPVMNCRKPCPGIAIISYNQSFWLGSPSRLYSVAQTRGCIKDVVYALCYRSDEITQMVLSGHENRVCGSYK